MPCQKSMAMLHGKKKNSEKQGHLKNIESFTEEKIASIQVHIMLIQENFPNNQNND